MANVTAYVPSNPSPPKSPIAELAISLTGRPAAVPQDVGVDAFAKLTLKQLQDAAVALGLTGLSRLKKDALVKSIWAVWQTATSSEPSAETSASAVADSASLGEAVTPVAHKFELRRPTPASTVAEPSRDIPWGYGRDRVTAMAVDPDRLFVYWELLEESIAKALRGLGTAGQGAWLNLRVYDTTGRIFDGTNAHGISDQGLDRAARQWFFTIGRPTSEVIVEIGMKSPGGAFEKIARSGRVEFPRREPVAWREPEWLTVRVTDGKVERAWLPGVARASAPPDPHHGRPVDGGHRAGDSEGDGVTAEVDGVSPLPLGPTAAIGAWDAIIRYAIGDGALSDGAIDWEEVKLPGGGFEAHRRITWEEHALVSSWQEGPFSYPVEVPAPVQEATVGRTRVFRSGTKTHVVYGPWQVTIRGLGATSSRSVVARWEVYRSWGEQEGRDVVQLTEEVGDAGAGGSHGRLVGSSERRWGGGSELRLGGASEVFFIGASERRLGGSSERLYAGASERLLKGSSERLLKGASEARLGGASEGRLGGSSGQGSHGVSPPASPYPVLVTPAAASKREGSR
jgi:hypothetical protein